MDWQACRKEMDKDILAEALSARTHGDPDVVRERSEARERLISWLDRLAAIDDISDLVNLVEIELMFLGHEERVCQDRPARLASVNAALEQMAAVHYHASLLLHEPRKYQEVDRLFSPSRHRIGGLPKDVARISLRSHVARLGNEIAATRGPDEELGLLASRQASTKTIQALYTAAQTQALTPPSPPPV